MAYKAPELILGASDYLVSGDMWSAGCILAELLSKLNGPLFIHTYTTREEMHSDEQQYGGALGVLFEIFKFGGDPRYFAGDSELKQLLLNSKVPQ